MLEVFFKKYPARQRVADVLFKRGLSVKDGKIVCDGIEIPFIEIARAAGVNRRIVYDTVEYIGRELPLRLFFERLRCNTDLFDVAPLMEMEALEVEVQEGHLQSAVEHILGAMEDRVRVRLMDARDVPGLGARLRIAVDGSLPAEILNSIKEVPYVRNIVLYTYDPSRAKSLCEMCEVKYCPRYEVRKRRGKVSVEI